jgi:antibiotic biosynthesis monooxygenase (ABM) superfamily enzyme
MKLAFDENGYLIPYEIIELEFDDFKRISLEGFEDSDIRQIIFENYEQFIEDFRNEITTGFVHWVKEVMFLIK